MTDFDTGPAPTSRTIIGSPKRCSRHAWVSSHEYEDGLWHTPCGYLGCTARPGTRCSRCGKPKDEAASRRGRTNRKRGGAIELQVAREMGMEKVGHHGGAEDARNAILSAQVKSGPGWYSPRDMAELDRLDARKTRILVKARTGMPGRKRDVLVTLTLGDLAELVGSDALVTLSLHPDWLDRFTQEGRRDGM